MEIPGQLWWTKSPWQLLPKFISSRFLVMLQAETPSTGWNVFRPLYEHSHSGFKHFIQSTPHYTSLQINISVLFNLGKTNHASTSSANLPGVPWRSRYSTPKPAGIWARNCNRTGTSATLAPKDPNPCKTHEALQTPPHQSSAKEFHPLLQCSRRVNSCHVLDLARAAGAFSCQVPVTAIVTN